MKIVYKPDNWEDFKVSKKTYGRVTETVYTIAIHYNGVAYISNALTKVEKKSAIRHEYGHHFIWVLPKGKVQTWLHFLWDILSILRLRNSREEVNGRVKILKRVFKHYRSWL